MLNDIKNELPSAWYPVWELRFSNVLKSAFVFGWARFSLSLVDIFKSHFFLQILYPHTKDVLPLISLWGRTRVKPIGERQGREPERKLECLVREWICRGVQWTESIQIVVNPGSGTARRGYGWPRLHTNTHRQTNNHTGRQTITQANKQIYRQTHTRTQTHTTTLKHAHARAHIHARIYMHSRTQKPKVKSGLAVNGRWAELVNFWLISLLSGSVRGPDERSFIRWMLLI